MTECGDDSFNKCWSIYPQIFGFPLKHLGLNNPSWNDTCLCDLNTTHITEFGQVTAQK